MSKDFFNWAVEPGVNSWLLFAAATEDRQHQGNSGYDDEHASVYRWDSTVPNHGAPSVGDLVVLRDAAALLGVSIIERISTSEGTKSLWKCPACRKASFKARSKGSALPAFRCFLCSEEFEQPFEVLKHVQFYEAEYGTNWVSLTGTLTAEEVRACCVSKRSQHSIRPIVWTELLRRLR